MSSSTITPAMRNALINAKGLMDEILALPENADEGTVDGLLSDLHTQQEIVRVEKEGYCGLTHIRDHKARELYLRSMPSSHSEEMYDLYMNEY